MKKVDVNALSGGEILSRDLYAQNYGYVLIPKGTVLKKEYIEKLELLGIHTVFIKETENISVKKEELMEDCQSQIKHVMERHIYKHNAELEKLCNMAENMIMEAIDEEPFNEEMVEIRESGGDMYTHSMQVCTLSTMLALKCGLDRRTVQDILKGALLHDIGLRYITVPYENVSIEELSQSSQEEYRRHTLEGYKALEQESWISSEVKNIIFFHHERIDGSGYPLKLSGDRLSLPIKIVTICDAFDEHLQGIGHKCSSLQEAREFLRDNKGILFDKNLTEEFLKMIVQYPTGCTVELSTGEKGRVICQNKEMPERPVVELLYDREGKSYTQPQELDLMKALHVFIVESSDEKHI